MSLRVRRSMTYRLSMSVRVQTVHQRFHSMNHALRLRITIVSISLMCRMVRSSRRTTSTIKNTMQMCIRLSVRHRRRIRLSRMRLSIIPHSR